MSMQQADEHEDLSVNNTCQVLHDVVGFSGFGAGQLHNRYFQQSLEK